MPGVSRHRIADVRLPRAQALRRLRQLRLVVLRPHMHVGVKALLVLALAANAVAATVHLRPVSPPAPVAVTAESLTVLGSDCWAAPVELPADAGEAEVRLWPRGSIHGHIAGGSVESLDLRIASPPEASPDRKLPDVTISCPVTAGELRCSVPAAAVDLRVSGGAFVPRYLWNVRVPAGATAELGDIRLERGASISGWVSTKNGPPAEAITVEIAPEEFVPGGRAADTKLRTRSVKPNRRAFFQLAGVPAGSYSVTARSEGWSPGRTSAVRITNGEVLLDEPFALQRLGTIELVIDPPLAHDSQPWRIGLTRRIPLSTFIADVAHDVAKPDGTWSRGGTETGTYQLVISDAAGSEYHRQEISVQPGTTTLPPISIRQVLVRGRLTAGGSAIRARLRFESGGARVTANSDEHGEFRAVLPGDGHWSVGIYPV